MIFFVLQIKILIKIILIEALIILIFLEEYPIPINQKESFQNSIPEKSNVSIQSANEKEFETSENNDQALEKQISIENNKCLDSLALVPITKCNSPSAKDRNVAGKKPRIFVRKNYRAKEKVIPPLHNQISEPRTKSYVFESFGKNPSNPKIDDLDLPIASRKGVCSCTKHPMSNYISYDKLSPTFLAFTSQLFCGNSKECTGSIMSSRVEKGYRRGDEGSWE